MAIWKILCTSKLLEKTTLILFLNKMDILKRKLRDGIMVNKYVEGYGNRPNEFTEVYRCKFIQSISSYVLTLV